MLRIIGCLLFIGSVFSLNAQKFDIVNKTKATLQANIEKWDITAQDVSEYFISDQTYSKHSGVTHIYTNQMYQGIPVYNAMINLNIGKDGDLIYAGSRFVKNLAKKVNTITPTMSPENAIASFAQQNDILLFSEELKRLKSNGEHDIIFQKTDFTKNDIPVRLMYYPVGEDQVRLAWDMSLNMKGQNHYWSARVDAVTGEILDQKDFVVKCSFDHAHYLAPSDHDQCDGHTHSRGKSVVEGFGTVGDGAKYFVYPVPTESPLHGDQQLVVDPSLELASPYGWHDLDGVEGADTTITRGNNTWAFADFDDNDRADGNEPNGGPELIFDFPHNQSAEPDDRGNVSADIVNLFYMVNFMHDFSYFYGFDEASGNFQENNYGKGGRGGDPIMANALDGFPNVEESRNNAFFSGAGDGSNATIGMFAWSAGANSLTILEPSPLAGSVESLAADGWGAPITDEALTGNIVLVDDESNTPTDGCQTIKNNIDGKIALIDRGICQFSSKALNAQNEGAIGVIVCNVAGADGEGSDGERMVGMAAGTDATLVTIPAIFIKKSDCDLIKVTLSDDVEVQVNFQLPQDTEGADELSGGFDNGIIAHEFAHGISIRLTGGPNNGGCLGNDEQMGEGWSDFFTLITSHRVGDMRETARGIGNYVNRSSEDGRGIRSQPYSTDLSVNSKTYDNIQSANSAHALGEVWAVTLWDMYWNFIDLYGFNPDWTNTESGNYKAIQLVMDGMKMQPCSPGFIDGRDAIMAADIALFGGEHECMLWETFARRGLGFFAVQGSSASQGDNSEDFEPLPTCIKELKIDKIANAVIDAGSEIEIVLNIANHKEVTLVDNIVSDNIPDGFDYVNNSATCNGCTILNAKVEGNQVVFEIGELTSLQEASITYSQLVPSTASSIPLLVRDFDDDFIGFVETSLVGNQFWSITDLDAYSGDRSYYIQDTEEEIDQVVQTEEAIRIEGDNPTLQFWHKYNTESGRNGGFIEISRDLDLWELIPTDLFLANGYNSGISYSLTYAIPNLEVFSGNSNGWVQTFVDMTPYADEDLYIRFRYGTSEEGGVATGENPGWFIDDFALVDLELVEGLACINAEEGDMACDGANFIINADLSSPTNEVLLEQHKIQFFPNPTDNHLNIQFNADHQGPGQVILSTFDGKKVLQKSISITNGGNYTKIDMSSLPDGIYIAELLTDEFLVAHKVIKN